MSGDDDEERVDRLRKRRQRQGPSEQPETDEPSEVSETSKSSKPSKTAEPSEPDKTSVKDEMVGTYMYLPEELKNELDLRFDELSLQHKREHGEPLEKNREFYPALVRAALNDDTTLSEQLFGEE